MCNLLRSPNYRLISLNTPISSKTGQVSNLPQQINALAPALSFIVDVAWRNCTSHHSIGLGAGVGVGPASAFSVYLKSTLPSLSLAAISMLWLDPSTDVAQPRWAHNEGSIPVGGKIVR